MHGLELIIKHLFSKTKIIIQNDSVSKSFPFKSVFLMSTTQTFRFPTALKYESCNNY